MARKTSHAAPVCCSVWFGLNPLSSFATEPARTSSRLSFADSAAPALRPLAAPTAALWARPGSPRRQRPPPRPAGGHPHPPHPEGGRAARRRAGKSSHRRCPPAHTRTLLALSRPPLVSWDYEPSVPTGRRALRDRLS